MECVRSGVLDLSCSAHLSGRKGGSTTSCGKSSSTNLVFSTKYQHNLQLAARGSSCLVHRSSVPKQQHNFSVRSSSADVCTTFNENVRGVFSHAAEEKVGVLLLNLGGPETLDDVQPFLFNLFADPDIIRLPRLFRFLQTPLAKLISTFRAPKSKEGYASIGGGSPLRKITDEQANALKLALKKKNLHADIYVGMRYWHPFCHRSGIQRNWGLQGLLLPTRDTFTEEAIDQANPLKLALKKKNLHADIYVGMRY